MSPSQSINVLFVFFSVSPTTLVFKSVATKTKPTTMPTKPNSTSVDYVTAMKVKPLRWADEEELSECDLFIVVSTQTPSL